MTGPGLMSTWQGTHVHREGEDSLKGWVYPERGGYAEMQYVKAEDMYVQPSMSLPPRITKTWCGAARTGVKVQL